MSPPSPTATLFSSGFPNSGKIRGLPHELWKRQPNSCVTLGKLLYFCVK